MPSLDNEWQSVSVTSDRYTLLLHRGPNMIYLSELQGETSLYLNSAGQQNILLPHRQTPTQAGFNYLIIKTEPVAWLWGFSGYNSYTSLGVLILSIQLE